MSRLSTDTQRDGRSYALHHKARPLVPTDLVWATINLFLDHSRVVDGDPLKLARQFETIAEVGTHREASINAFERWLVDQVRPA